MEIAIDKIVLSEALSIVADEYGVAIPRSAAVALVLSYLEGLNSDDRDFSDAMLARRKRFAEAVKNNPEECHSKLWEDSE